MCTLGKKNWELKDILKNMGDEKEEVGIERWRQNPRWDAVPWKRLSLYWILLCRTPCRSLAEIHQIVKCQTRGKGWGGAHTPYDMCEATGTQKCRKKSVSVREGEPQLVRRRQELPAQTCACIFTCVWVCVRSVSSLQTAGRGRKRGSGSECSEHSIWLMNRDRGTPQDSGECEVTRRHGMPLENCRTLCMPVFMFECVYPCVYIGEQVLTRLSCLYL